MADKNIGALAAAADLYDDSLLVAEQQGAAVKVTGRQFKSFAQAAVRQYVDDAQNAANDALAAVGQVGTAVEDTQANAAAAAASAQKAQQYSGKPPVIQSGTWWTWMRTARAIGTPARPPEGAPARRVQRAIPAIQAPRACRASGAKRVSQAHHLS